MPDSVERSRSADTRRRIEEPRLPDRLLRHGSQSAPCLERSQTSGAPPPTIELRPARFNPRRTPAGRRIRCDGMRITVRLFAALRETGRLVAARARAARRRGRGGRVAGARSGRRAARPRLRAQPRVRRARGRGARRRRGGGHPARLGRRVHRAGGAARPRRGRAPGRRPGRRRDRHLHRHHPHAQPRAHRRPPRVRRLPRDGRGRDGADRRGRAARATTCSASRSPTAPGTSRSARRA